MYHPVFGNKFGAITFAVGWITIIVIHFTVLYVFYNIASTTALVDAIFANSLFAILSLGLWFLVSFSNIETSKPLGIIINHLGAASLSITAIVSIHHFLLIRIYSDSIEYQKFLEASIPGRIITGLFIYLIVCLTYYLIIYISSFREKVTRELELKALVKDAELNWLKLQLNPHFLFNSLNSVSSLTMTAPDKAQEMIIRLSELLRYSLKQEPNSMVTLDKEIENCKKYLEIEKVRFGKRLNYSIIVDDESIDTLIPGMIIQPLFENAIKHSVAVNTGESFVSAVIEKKPNYLSIQVSNSMPTDNSFTDGTGVGLENLKRRLNLIYGTSNLLRIYKTDSDFLVTITIPL